MRRWTFPQAFPAVAVDVNEDGRLVGFAVDMRGEVGFGCGSFCLLLVWSCAEVSQTLISCLSPMRQESPPLSNATIFRNSRDTVVSNLVIPEWSE